MIFSPKIDKTIRVIHPVPRRPQMQYISNHILSNPLLTKTKFILLLYIHSIPLSKFPSEIFTPEQ